MLLPNKIIPKHLKDTIVEYRFLSDVQYGILPGLIYHELKEDFNLLPNTINPPTVLSLAPGHELRFDDKENIQFVNDIVKIQLIEESLERRIVFNSFAGKYSGWNEYSKCINFVLDKLFGQNYIKSISRIGIRYINEYPNKTVSELIKGMPSLPAPLGDGINSTFRTEIRTENYTIIFNVADQVRSGIDKENVNSFSLIDLDVNKVFRPALESAVLIKEKTDFLHTVIKETFFSLISEDFIKTLNPEYTK